MVFPRLSEKTLTVPPFNSSPTRIISLLFHHACPSTTAMSSSRFTSVSEGAPATGLIRAKRLTLSPTSGQVLKSVRSTSPISDWQVMNRAACLRTMGVTRSGVKTSQETMPAVISRTASRDAMVIRRTFMNFLMADRLAQ